MLRMESDLQAEPLDAKASAGRVRGTLVRGQDKSSGDDDVKEDGPLRRGLVVRALCGITVEPVLFAYMFAFMLTSVVEQTFYVDRACRVNLNFSDHVCSNIQNMTYKEQLTQVQVK